MKEQSSHRDLDAENGIAYLKARNEIRAADGEALADAWRQVGDDMSIAMRNTVITLGLHLDPELDARANEAEKRNRERLRRLRGVRGLGRFSIFG